MSSIIRNLKYETDQNQITSVETCNSEQRFVHKIHEKQDVEFLSDMKKRQKLCALKGLFLDTWGSGWKGTPRLDFKPVSDMSTFGTL